MPKAIVDNDKYIRSRTKFLQFDIPKKDEVGYAHVSIDDLLSLLYTCPLGENSPRRILNRFVRRWIANTLSYIEGVGYLRFIQDMKRTSHSFLKAFKYDDDGVVRFVWHRDFSNSPVASAIRICEKIYQDGKESPKLVTWIHTWHAFLAKVPLTRPDLADSTREGWKDLQVHHVKDIDQMNMDYVLGLRLIVSWLFDEDVPEVKQLLGKHGPGNTSLGHKTVPDKEDNLIPVLQAQSVVPSYHAESRATSPVPLYSEYAEVPKDNGAMRSITQESIDMMRGQQGIKRWMYSATDNRRVQLSHFVKFSDQTASRDAALKSSKLAFGWKKLVTADLSHASDLVSSDLVAFVFGGNLNFALMALRTWHILLPPKDAKEVTAEDFIEPRMYAGMGAATTFPIQTIVFTAISILSLCIEWYKDTYGGIPRPEDESDGLYGDVVRELLSEPRTKSNLKYGFWSVLKNIRTYGDDIIIQDICLDRLGDILSSLGLRLNVNKTFFGQDAVRESCGMYALNGCDITPLRYRIPIHSPEKQNDFAVFDAVRNLANRSYIFGYKSYSRRLVRRLELLVPFGSTRSFTKKWHMINGHDAGVNLVSTNSYERDPDKEVSREETYERNVEYVEGGTPQVMYETYRGPHASYLGVISNKVNSFQLGMINGDVKLYIVALIGTPKTERDHSHDEYYLEQTLFDKMALPSDIDVEDSISGHGALERGIRLKARIAYRLEIGEEVTWAWAPALVGY